MIAPDSASAGDRWYVYLLVLTDRSAFKAGFSCNPFQRAYAFSRRYFERFDLHRSLIVQLHACDEARALEAAIKSELAMHRSACPAWVPVEAGGHTEWFDALQWERAETRLLAADVEGVGLATAADLVRAELQRQASSFELWSLQQSQFIAQALSSSLDAHLAFGVAGSLRDWLDAYRALDIALFADDPAVEAFVNEAARQA